MLWRVWSVGGKVRGLGRVEGMSLNVARRLVVSFVMWVRSLQNSFVESRRKLMDAFDSLRRADALEPCGITVDYDEAPLSRRAKKVKKLISGMQKK